MYLTLFRLVTKAIQLLQEAQQETEAIYIESEPVQHCLRLKSRRANPIPIEQMKSSRSTAGQS